MDVLEAGSDAGRARRRAPRVARLAAALAVGVLVVAVIAGATQWWLQQDARPDRLEIVRVDAIGPFAISGDDLPDGWPADLVVGAVRLRSGTSYAVPFLVAQLSQSLFEGVLTRADWLGGRGVPVTDLGATGRDPVFGWGLPKVPLRCG